jgi:glycosyltransferase involved in cell wall biosynthesis
MRFSIITPTHKRSEKLQRAVASVLRQTYRDFELIVINDSPDDTSYEPFEHSITDSRIRYLKNKKNMGLNYSRNRGLDEVSIYGEWVIFLDDDDYFAPDALATFKTLIEEHPNERWFVTNRAHIDGTPFTIVPKADTHYSYGIDVLLLKKFRGDATHCISKKELTSLRFSKRVRQAEEWIFYYEIGTKTKFFYHDHNSTISDGYTASGLNYRQRSRDERIHTLLLLLQDGLDRKLVYRPTFIAYAAARCILLLKKN